MSYFTALLALAATVSSSPIERRADNIITVPLTYNRNITSSKNLVAKGRARLDKVNRVSTTVESRADSGAVTNEDVSYVAPVSIGGTTWQLIVDTGSSNTWCGAQTACEGTSTGEFTGGIVEVSYGSGEFFGFEYTDVVKFGGATVNSQSIGAALTSEGFTGVDGIIGFGPVDLTEETVSNANTVPTFTNNLYSQKTISIEVLGVSFRPEVGDDVDATNGELTLGGTAPSRYTGSITYFPKLTSGDAAGYWGISVNEFSYGTENLGSSNAAIVDTGTTLIYIPTSAYNKFLSATGGTTDENSGLASFTTKPTQNFDITFGSTTYTLTPSQYLLPTAQYSEFDAASGKYYAYINDGGDSGTDAIIGQKFLEQFYAVFDTTNSRIGFATAA